MRSEQPLSRGRISPTPGALSLEQRERPSLLGADKCSRPLIPFDDLVDRRSLQESEGGALSDKLVRRAEEFAKRLDGLTQSLTFLEECRVGSEETMLLLAVVGHEGEREVRPLSFERGMPERGGCSRVRVLSGTLHNLLKQSACLRLLVEEHQRLDPLVNSGAVDSTASQPISS